MLTAGMLIAQLSACMVPDGVPRKVRKKCSGAYMLLAAGSQACVTKKAVQHIQKC
jgi:hypothetical protein